MPSEMPKQDKIVITDASCFILLDKIGGLDLLNSLYKHIITTPEIAAEYKKRLPEWVEVKAITNREYCTIMQKQLISERLALWLLR